MASSPQARVPMGVSTGGQFAPEHRQETSVKLFDRDGGTYLNPAPSKTAEHCIDFWSKVPIPDEIVDQVKTAHENDRITHVNELMEQKMQEWSDEWAEANPSMKRQKDIDARDSRYREEHEAYRLSILPGVQARRSSQLNIFDAPQVIRAWKMFTYAPNSARWPEEAKAVADHPIELFDRTLTVNEINMAYRMDRIEAYTDRVYHVDQNAAVVAELANVNARLAGVHNEIAMQGQGRSGY